MVAWRKMGGEGLLWQLENRTIIGRGWKELGGRALLPLREGQEVVVRGGH